ncbi:MAG: S-layer homology domain-containing protein [Bacillota bacterium]|nr:S-layer homology domain-containing protein [Bacillota bacterium]
MKMKKSFISRISAVLLAILFLFSVEAEGTPSDWSSDTISRAIENGIITDSIKDNYQQSITRLEFCELVMKLYAATNGDDNISTVSNPFTDTDNADVIKAYSLGFVHGVADDKFAPDENITRQEICVMLYRTVNILGFKLNLSAFRSLDSYTDLKNVASWAKDAVEYMLKAGIMAGTSTKTISPNDTTTREQAVVFMMRVFDEIKMPDFTVGGTCLRIGYTKNYVINHFGAPDRIDETAYNYDWYVYDKDYNNFVMIGIENNRVSAILSNAPTFTFAGFPSGTLKSSADESIKPYASNCIITLLEDKIDSDKVIGIYTTISSKKDTVDDSVRFRCCEMEIFDCTNAFRVMNGKEPLAYSDTVSEVAFVHSKDMGEKDYFDHTTPEGKTLEDRLSEVGITVSSASENIAGGLNNGYEACFEWINSDKNRANMLGDYTSTGIGMADGKHYLHYFTQILYREDQAQLVK